MKIKTIQWKHLLVLALAVFASTSFADGKKANRSPAIAKEEVERLVAINLSHQIEQLNTSEIRDRYIVKERVEQDFAEQAELERERARQIEQERRLYRLYDTLDEAPVMQQMMY